jgi:cardiolipin synthase
MDFINWLLVAIHTSAGFATAGHALLYKSNPRSALGWIAVCLTFPFAGAIFYCLFGINRVQTRAKVLDQRSDFHLHVAYERSEDVHVVPPTTLPVPSHLRELTRMSDAVTGRPLTSGNRIEPLYNGEQAYPAMLEAIANARHRLYLTTYLFTSDKVGKRFVDALAEAAQRGVDVKVMIDGVGEWYGLPRIGALLKQHGLPMARFLPPTLLPPSVHINLRNHRKILVADSQVGFTGGMNIGGRHLVEGETNRHGTKDIHFRLTGPVVEDMAQVFLSDWGFVTGEYIAPPTTTTVTDFSGNAICRTIVDGPNEDLGRLATILVGAIALARKRIVIVTPYFLPSLEIIVALQAAALRGVQVTIILPAKNNLPFVHWATRNMLWQLLRWGVRVYYQPPPFAHTKLFLVDNHYTQIGSANIDSRSLRLNFELAIEVYDEAFSALLTNHVENLLVQSQEIFLEDIERRALVIRTRDAIAWLFSPYL